MSQKANLGEMVAPHPVFANAHNTGQKTTTHRSIEKARALVSKHGVHPEKGNFRENPPRTTDGFIDYANLDPNHTEYTAPAGGKVMVHKPAGQENLAPDDQQIHVTDSEGTHQLSQPAARTYIQDRFAIPI